MERAAASDMAYAGQDTKSQGAHAMRAPYTRDTRLSFANVSHSVELCDAIDLYDSLKTVMPGWGLRQGCSRR